MYTGEITCDKHVGESAINKEGVVSVSVGWITYFVTGTALQKYDNVNLPTLKICSMKQRCFC
jgi:hypothetical protein